MHDKSGVLVALFTQRVELSNGIIESLLGEMAGLIWRVQNLVVEHAEVQGKAEADRMCWCEVSRCNFGSVLVRFKRLVGACFPLVGNGEFGKVSVIVALPVSHDQ